MVNAPLFHGLDIPLLHNPQFGKILSNGVGDIAGGEVHVMPCCYARIETTTLPAFTAGVVQCFAHLSINWRRFSIKSVRK